MSVVENVSAGDRLSVHLNKRTELNLSVENANPRTSPAEMFSKWLQNAALIGLLSEHLRLFSGHRLLSVVNKERPAAPLFSFAPKLASLAPDRVFDP